MSITRLEAVLASIDAQAESTQTKLDQAAEFATRSEHLEVEGESGDRLTRVTVDGTGQVQSILIDEDFRSATAPQLAASVMEAIRQAQRRLSFRIDELGKEIYGEGSPTVDAFTSSYRNRYGYEEIPE